MKRKYRINIIDKNVGNKMKILYFHQHFSTNSGGTRSFELAKYIVGQGNRVTIISGGSRVRDEKVSGIEIRRTGTNYLQKMSFLKRIYSFIHYLIISTFIGLKEKDVDLVYSTSTPLTIGIPAIILKKLKNQKFIFEVRDLWPDVPVELGFIKNKILIWLLYKLEIYIYNQSEAIIVLSTGMKKELLEKGISEHKITVVENMAFREDMEKSQRKELIEITDFNLENKLVCVHHGTMGYVNGLEYILDLAYSYPHKDIVYLLIGNGKERQKLVEKIESKGIRNVLLIDSMKKEDVFGVLKSSDVGLMIVRNELVLENNSANKFFDFLAAGLPVVVNYGGWQKQVLEENKAGRGFNYNDKKSVYEYLKMFLEDKELLNEISNNSFELSGKYDSNLLSESILNLIETIK